MSNVEDYGGNFVHYAFGIREIQPAGVVLIVADGEDLAAEELIALILRCRKDKERRNEPVTRVVLSMPNYRKIKHFHATLGELPAEHIDYISGDTIFNLPVYIDNTVEYDVQ